MVVKSVSIKNAIISGENNTNPMKNQRNVHPGRLHAVTLLDPIGDDHPTPGQLTGTDDANEEQIEPTGHGVGNDELLGQ